MGVAVRRCSQLLCTRPAPTLTPPAPSLTRLHIDLKYSTVQAPCAGPALTLWHKANGKQCLPQQNLFSSRIGMYWPWYSIPGVGTTSIILTTNQLQLVANMMWMLTCRCMIWFRHHDDLLWGFHIFRSRPSSRVQVCVEGHARGTLADGLPFLPLAVLLEPPQTSGQTCSSCPTTTQITQTETLCIMNNKICTFYTSLTSAATSLHF